LGSSVFEACVQKSPLCYNERGNYLVVVVDLYLIHHQHIREEEVVMMRVLNDGTTKSPSVDVQLLVALVALRFTSTLFRGQAGF